MEAERVIPVEPHPRAVSAIKAMAARNGLSNVDLSCLGCAVGAQAGRLRLVPSETAGLGATHAVPDRQGTAPCVPIDALLPGRVDFLKLDVEGMELEALAGGASLIARFRPAIYVEVLDRLIGEFLGWVDRNGYRIEKVFPDKTHCNYLLYPMERVGKATG
jgi:FkbM family methyltransferase